MDIFQELYSMLLWTLFTRWLGFKMQERLRKEVSFMVHIKCTDLIYT